MRRCSPGILSATQRRTGEPIRLTDALGRAPTIGLDVAQEQRADLVAVKMRCRRWPASIPAPVLTLNGRYDDTFRLNTSQKPFVQWLGTPENDKRHVVYDAAHDVMINRTAVVTEVLSWLDQYLGPAGQPPR
jgi:hypothetical protein